MSTAAQTARTPEKAPTPPPGAGTAHSLLNLQQAVSAPPDFPSDPPPVDSASLPMVDRECLRHLEIMRRDCPEPVLHSFRQLRGRLIRRAVDLTGSEPGLRTVFVTSPKPRTGKSFVARNLSLMMGVIPECRVLLAETNPARPELTRLFGLDSAPGIRDTLNSLGWREMARRIPGIDVCVAGAGSVASDALDPFDARLIQRFRQGLEDDFDWLILDGPSLEESADAEMLSHLSDLTVVVLRPGEFGCRELGRSIARLHPAKVAGFVFNKPR